jgi:hypothetical protein
MSDSRIVRVFVDLVGDWLTIEVLVKRGDEWSAHSIRLTRPELNDVLTKETSHA